MATISATNTMHSSAHTSVKVSPFQQHLQTVLDKLKKDPLTITAEDGRRLHEHFDARDERSARIISAVEALALANQDLAKEKGEMLTLGQPGHVSLLTVIEDFLAGMTANPEDVTDEVLTLAQLAVSKCQKAVGQATASHPELENDLQEQYAKIGSKISEGTVTVEEANHLHSLEARVHGHTEKGGLTSKAQSVATKRERQASLSEASNHLEKLNLGSKVEEKAASVTGEDEGKERIVQQPSTSAKENRAVVETV